MIPITLAQELRDAGLRWSPEAGDRFVIPNPEMRDEVFVVSTMVVDVYDFPTGQVLGFNGTVEWALDSIERDKALWLPSETQLRERLGGTFCRLEPFDGGYRVTMQVAGRDVAIEGGTVEIAYGRALLHLATGE